MRWVLMWCVVAAAIAPAPASAAVVGHAPGSPQLLFVADPGEANRVTVTSGAGMVTFTDPGAGAMGASGDCGVSGPGTASCPAIGITAVTVLGGDGDDQITNATGVPGELRGEDGNDVLHGGAAAERLDGGAGGDTLDGGIGNDLEDGGPGDDTLSPGAGPSKPDADAILGGDGLDAVSYATRTNAVNVTKDGAANDGEAGEGDNVGVDVESIRGGVANDSLQGGVSADVLEAGPGDDTLSGGLGPDRLLGGPGRDVVTYAATADVTVSLTASLGASAVPGDSDRIEQVEDVRGGSERDTVTGTGGPNDLEGAGGEDYLDARSGVDDVDGGTGADVVVARDGVRDGRVSCGPGEDFAIVDRHDRVVGTGQNRCEQADDGRATKLRPGWVYVHPERCSTPEDQPELGLPAMHRLVPLRYSVMLRSGYRGRKAPWFDATGCSVRVTATPGRGARASADVSGGAARVDQTGRRAVTTVLTVVPPDCGSGRRADGNVRRPHRLRVNARRRHGRWGVDGEYSLAASEGTDWTTIEECSRTTTIVRQGRIRVYDRVKRRTVTVRAGHRYVARAPR